jgi:adenylate cyclase
VRADRRGSALIDPKIAEHNGRLVKTTGDGLLVEFSSVVDALRCASEVQAGIAERNATVPTDNRIELRIGINVGDVVVEDGDIFGDGVNIAARLEGLAEPGGICVSALVQRDAAGKLDLPASLQPGERGNLVARHQPAVASYVGGEDRSKFALYRLDGHAWLLPIRV